MDDQAPPAGLDPATVAAIAVVAYVVANVLHEGLGHAGARRLVGGRAELLSTAHFAWDAETTTEGGRRLVAAAGTLVNLAAALGFWALGRRLRTARGPLRFLLWISMAVNLLVGTGYFLFSGVTGVGDWVQVVAGWQPAGLWRLALALTGLLLYLGAIAVCLRTLAPLVGGEPPTAIRRAVRLTVLPYVVGSLASTLGAFLNPVGLVLVATSAAAHFGGTSALAWMAQMLKTPLFPPGGGSPIAVPRSWAWIALAAVLLAIHVAVLGPGVALG